MHTMFQHKSKCLSGLSMLHTYLAILLSPVPGWVQV